MSGLLPYLALALVFLLVSAAVAWLGMDGRSSAASRRLSVRLLRLAQPGRVTAQQARWAEQAAPTRWQRLPGAARLEVLLQRSGSSRSPAQVLAGCALAALACALLLRLGGVSTVLCVALAGPAAGLPLARLAQLAHKRRLRFEDQLPEALDLMTRALRAGYGLSMALAMVGDELREPLAGEFRHACDQLHVGLGFGEAMGEMALRVRSQDLNFLVIALTIQRKTGGNLTELLTSLAKTMRERVKLKGKVRVLASEGRLSGLMIGALPFVLGCVLTLVNPTYMATLWTTEAGRTALMVGLGMLAVGGLWMWKIVQIRA